MLGETRKFKIFYCSYFARHFPGLYSKTFGPKHGVENLGQLFEFADFSPLGLITLHHYRRARQTGATNSSRAPQFRTNVGSLVAMATSYLLIFSLKKALRSTSAKRWYCGSRGKLYLVIVALPWNTSACVCKMGSGTDDWRGE
jgi:hypothetical protein